MSGPPEPERLTRKSNIKVLHFSFSPPHASCLCSPTITRPPSPPPGKQYSGDTSCILRRTLHPLVTQSWPSYPAAVAVLATAAGSVLRISFLRNYLDVVDIHRKHNYSYLLFHPIRNSHPSIPSAMQYHQFSRLHATIYPSLVIY